MLRSQKRFVEKEIAALAINLSTNASCVSVLNDRDTLHQLVKRVHHTNDPLLMKILHNLSAHPGKSKEAIAVQTYMILPRLITWTNENLQKYVHEFFGMMKRTQNHDFLLETLGTVAHLDLPRLSFAKILSQHDFVEFLLKHLVPGFTDDDIVLEVVMILGTVASDPKAATLLANSRLVTLLSQTLTGMPVGLCMNRFDHSIGIQMCVSYRKSWRWGNYHTGLICGISIAASWRYSCSNFGEWWYPFLAISSSIYVISQTWRLFPWPSFLFVFLFTPPLNPCESRTEWWERKGQDSSWKMSWNCRGNFSLGFHTVSVFNSYDLISSSFCLDQEFANDDWKNKFKIEQFEAHNREWLDIVNGAEFTDESRSESMRVMMNTPFALVIEGKQWLPQQ